ncbi:Acid proteinase [Coniochaeta hoffmannii]|uniref:Acid proteinase n=1 Tax=Coniochaeta hoffmannii TaxID=91930 RepID=A0AA38W1B1_9PEZI|nr:Acid proteinase [Coniochaeta hoffmannii]
MKFTAALLALAGLAAAFPAPESIDLGDGVKLVRRAPRSDTRRAAHRKTNPKIPAPLEEGALGAEAATNETQVSYSTNWAGAVLVGSGYKSVTGTFVVPTPKRPSGSSSSTTYSASAWVGIDGDTCQTAILQTGVDFNIQGSTVSYDAWYEWYPEYAYTFTGFSIAAGNTIKVTATASSTSAGSVTITNVSTGKTVTHSFSGESGKLCETNAEWIVEDFEENGSLVPFANFGTVTFTSASVTTTGGSTLGVSGAEILDIKQGSTVLTDCSASGSSVTCTYV